MSDHQEPRQAPNDLPAYVIEALRGLTRAQKRYVMDGSIHGDPTMATIRALKAKALFYLKIDSPNGRAGFLVPTPLGVTVQRILKERAALTPSPATACSGDADTGEGRGAATSGGSGA